MKVDPSGLDGWDFLKGELKGFYNSLMDATDVCSGFSLTLDRLATLNPHLGELQTHGEDEKDGEQFASVLSFVGQLFSGGASTAESKIGELGVVEEFAVGTKDALKARGVESGLHLHHVPQGQLAKQVVPGYDYEKGLVIALKKGVHESLSRASKLKGNFSGISKSEARLLISRQIRDVVGTNAPKEQVIKLVKLMKQMYPSIYER